MRVVGITGLAGSGKTTVARYLMEWYGYARIRFADALKMMARERLNYVGVDETTIDRMIDGDLKEIPTDYLSGKTPRQYMQRLGTQFGREQIDENHWIHAWTDRAAWQKTEGVPGIVADDVRFHNEVEAIYKWGGIVVKVTRPDLELAADVAAHESERYANELPYDVHLINDGSIGDLLKKIDYRVVRYCPDKEAA